MTKISLLAVISVFNWIQLPAHAVTTGPSSSQASSPSALAVIKIERGGTINSIDLKKKLILVDGVSWSLAGASVKGIASASNGSKTSQFESTLGLSDLKPGMPIRFVTVKKNTSNQDQILEIIVTVSQVMRP